MSRWMPRILKITKKTWSHEILCWVRSGNGVIFYRRMRNVTERWECEKLVLIRLAKWSWWQWWLFSMCTRLRLTLSQSIFKIISFVMSSTSFWVKHTHTRPSFIINYRGNCTSQLGKYYFSCLLSVNLSTCVIPVLARARRGMSTREG